MICSGACCVAVFYAARRSAPGCAVVCHAAAQRGSKRSDTVPTGTDALQVLRAEACWRPEVDAWAPSKLRFQVGAPVSTRYTSSPVPRAPCRPPTEHPLIPVGTLRSKPFNAIQCLSRAALPARHWLCCAVRSSGRKAVWQVRQDLVLRHHRRAGEPACARVNLHLI